MRERARRQAQQAKETVARNHRRAAAEARSRPRAASEAASAEQRHVAHQQWYTSQPTPQPTGKAAHGVTPTGEPPTLRRRLVAAAYAAIADGPATGPAPPAAHEQGSVYERARARAAAERRTNRRATPPGHRRRW